MCLYLKLLHKILNFSSGYFLHALGTSWLSNLDLDAVKEHD